MCVCANQRLTCLTFPQRLGPSGSVVGRLFQGWDPEDPLLHPHTVHICRRNDL